MKYLADLIVTIRAKYYSFEMANPRHEHEWQIWRDGEASGRQSAAAGLHHAGVRPRRTSRACGAADRRGSPKIVGRERVIASADCGFASTLYTNKPPEIEAEIVWAKFESLVEGARLASKVLWA